jgi:hypothetical protein
MTLCVPCCTYFPLLPLLIEPIQLFPTMKKLNSNQLLINMGIGLAIAKRSAGIAKRSAGIAKHSAGIAPQESLDRNRYKYLHFDDFTNGELFC